MLVVAVVRDELCDPPLFARVALPRVANLFEIDLWLVLTSAVNHLVTSGQCPVSLKIRGTQVLIYVSYWRERSACLNISHLRLEQRVGHVRVIIFFLHSHCAVW